MSWKNKIEAQIAAIGCKQSTDCYLNAGCIENRCQLQESMQALLDVAVAADAVSKCKGQTLLGCAPDNDYPNVPDDEQSAHMYGSYKAFNQCASIVNSALDKLREAEDETEV